MARVMDWMLRVNREIGLGELGEFEKGKQAMTCDVISHLQEAIAALPPDDSAKVQAVIEAARAWCRTPVVDSAAQWALLNSVKVLDEKRGLR